MTRKYHLNKPEEERAEREMRRACHWNLVLLYQELNVIPKFGLCKKVASKVNINANMIWHLKVSTVKFAKPFLRHTIYLEKVMYKHCYRYFWIFWSHFGPVVLSYLSSAYWHTISEAKVQEWFTIHWGSPLFRTHTTLSYTKAQKFFDGTKIINVRVDWVTATNT